MEIRLFLCELYLHLFGYSDSEMLDRFNNSSFLAFRQSSFVSDTLGVQNVNIRFRDENRNVSEAFNISFETVNIDVFERDNLMISQNIAVINISKQKK